MGRARTSRAARSASGKSALGVAEALERFLQVKRDGVVDLRADLAGGEKFAQGVAASGADDVLVPDVAAAGNFVRKDDAVDGVSAGFGQARGVKERVVTLGDGAAGLVPVVDVLELDLEDGALEAVHAGVPAQFVVVVAAAHAVLAQHAGALGQLVGVGGDHAGVAGGAEVLGGIEAEGGGIAQARRL